MAKRRDLTCEAGGLSSQGLRPGVLLDRSRLTRPVEIPGQCPVPDKLTSFGALLQAALAEKEVGSGPDPDNVICEPTKGGA